MEGDRPAFPTVSQAFSLILITLFLSFAGEWLLHDRLGRVSLLLLELLFLLPAVLYVFLQRLDFRETFRLYAVDRRILAWSLLMGLGLSVVIDEADRLIQMVFPMPEMISDAIQAMLVCRSAADFALVISAGVIAAGIAEEMLFRGFFQGVLERHLDTTKAVNLSAFVFALVHFNPWWFVQIILMGIVMGVLTWRTRSVYPAILVHMVNNAVSVALMNTDAARLEWYVFKGHVSPILLAAGVGCIIYGFRAVYRRNEVSDHP